MKDDANGTGWKLCVHAHNKGKQGISSSDAKLAGGRQNQKPCTQLTRQIIICMTALVRFIWHAYFIGEDVGAPLMLGLFDLLS